MAGFVKRRHHLTTEEELLRRICINVRLRREATGWTAEMVAARAGIHHRHLQKVQAGTANITLETLVRIGVGLGVDPVTLLKEPFPKETDASES